MKECFLFERSDHMACCEEPQRIGWIGHPADGLAGGRAEEGMGWIGRRHRLTQDLDVQTGMPDFVDLVIVFGTKDPDPAILAGDWR